MPPPTLLVLADPGDRYLSMLDALRDRVELVIGASAAEFDGAADRARAMLAWAVKREEIGAVLKKAPHLEWLHVRWAGLDTLMFPELVEHRVTLTNSRGVYSQSLGEFAILGALYFAKDVARLMAHQREANWAPSTMLELRGATMGIVGYGDIGRCCASRAHALGMRVLATRKKPELSHQDPFIALTYSPDGLLQMIEQTDYLVVSAPLTPETRGMIGQREIASMKHDAVLINVGRGAVIDEAALARALEAKRIRGAALDVFEIEPLPKSSKLWSLDNVLISPHCADNTPTWNEEAMQLFLANFEGFVSGQPLRNVVNKAAGY